MKLSHMGAEFGYFVFLVKANCILVIPVLKANGNIKCRNMCGFMLGMILCGNKPHVF